MVNFGVVKKSVKDIMTNGKKFLYDNKDVSKANFVGCIRLNDNKVTTDIFEHTGKGEKHPQGNFCAMSQKGTNTYPTGSRASNAKPHEIKIESKSYFWFDYR